MNQEKKIAAPRVLWDRLRAMMGREGIETINEAVRHCIRKEVEASEANAARVDEYGTTHHLITVNTGEVT